MGLVILVIVLVVAVVVSNIVMKWANRDTWVKYKETNTEIYYVDSKNNDNPNSTRSNGWKFVRK